MFPQRSPWLTQLDFLSWSPSSITPKGILPQPPGKTAIISGLNYITRIFALLGEILVRIRIDKRFPPQGRFATSRLEEVRSLHQQIVTALALAPPPLQLKNHVGGTPQPPPADHDNPGFTKATFAKVKDFFDNPNASRANASNAYLVMQANLYVTQVRRLVSVQGRRFLKHCCSNWSAS